MQDKACAIVLRKPASVLVFRHPTAGVQLVKGSVASGETPSAAARRELTEESGLTALTVTPVAMIPFTDLNERWHVFICDVAPTPDCWRHQTADDHGHVFTFFWHALGDPYPVDMDQRYVRVLERLRAA